MKAEINNENKAKFFAQYWGQKVVSHLEYPDLSTNTIDGALIKKYSEEDYFLILKPLSSISDEDARFICSLHKVISTDYKWLFLGINLSGYDVDYLRLKGYAVPAFGLSVEEMVEAGWIKLIE